MKPESWFPQTENWAPRPARLRKVFEDAGYTHFRRAAQTPMNLILEARA